MKIAICDDAKEYRQLISRYINFYFKNHFINFECYEFSSGEALLSQKQNFDIVFLDIEMDELNGIQTAKQINQRSRTTVIFIITAYQKYLDDAMDLNIFRFIDKPINAQRIYNGLDKAIKNIKNNNISFRTRNDGIVTMIKNDIVCVEVSRKQVFVTTVDNKYVAREKMDFFKENLTSSNFAIPHNSYVINFNFVANFYRNKVHLKDGQIISIAPKKQVEIRKKFIRFLGEDYDSLSDDI